MAFNEQIYDEQRDNPEGRSVDDTGLWTLQHSVQHPSHWQANRTAADSTATCECGHPKYAHNDDGRCRARRHRCTCRTFVAQQFAQRSA